MDDDRLREKSPGADRDRNSLVYYAPLDPGGLVHYAIEHVHALAGVGVNVTVVGCDEVIQGTKDAITSNSVVLERPARRSGSRIGRAIEYAQRAYGDAGILGDVVRRLGTPPVLISAFVEYFAPIWAPRMRRIRRRGVRFGVLVHDPVRDFQAGPKLWHHWSISQAYSFMDVAFTHGASRIDTGWSEQTPKIVEVPHGYRDVAVPGDNRRDALRRALNIPTEARVFLMFGHIRDGKNLDLVLRALQDIPDAVLLVVGREQSTAQKPVEFYQALAAELGVAPRCRWVHEFVPDDEVAQYFQASDILLLPYSRDFRSSSGVLAVASQFQLGIVASGGEGPLRPAIENYRLGDWCEPDSVDALRVGMVHQLSTSDRGDWTAYRADHSWEANAWTCATELGLSPVKRGGTAGGRDT